jgi:hypothetical protein
MAMHKVTQAKESEKKYLSNENNVAVEARGLCFLKGNMQRGILYREYWTLAYRSKIYRGKICFL